MLRSDDSGFCDVTACCKWGVPLYLNAVGKGARWLSGKLGQCPAVYLYTVDKVLCPLLLANQIRHAMSLSNTAGAYLLQPDQMVMISLQTMLRVSPFLPISWTLLPVTETWAYLLLLLAQVDLVLKRLLTFH
jgi:hypothetical protein